MVNSGRCGAASVATPDDAHDWHPSKQQLASDEQLQWSRNEMATGASGRGRASTPAWAQAVTTKVCNKYGLSWWDKDVRWRTDRTGKKYSTGVTRWTMGTHETAPCYVTVTAGTDVIDQCVTLLHELAHVIVGHDAAHGSQFWKVAFTLFCEYEMPFPYWYYSSAQYKETAMHTAEIMFDISTEHQRTCREIMDRKRKLGSVNIDSWQPVRFPWRELLQLDVDA